MTSIAEDMMAADAAAGHRVLITGVSGYLGGTLLAQLSAPESSCRALFSSSDRLFALVRSDSQAGAVREHHPGVRPLQFDAYDAEAVRAAVVGNGITVVFSLIDAVHATAPENFLRALAEVRRETGQDVHFLHTSGAKLFSSHSGAPVSRSFADDVPDIYAIQKAQKSPYAMLQEAIATNNTIIETGEALHVKTYIFVPCIVYGKGQGFGNRISIQTVAIVRAFKATKRVCKVDTGRPTWPVSHLSDTVSLYAHILDAILASASGAPEPPHGLHGYYLAASGSVAWDDLYKALGKALAKRGLVANLDETKDLPQADADDMKAMAAALECPEAFIPVQLGGQCTFTAHNGLAVGWQSQHEAEHILETAQEEADWILENL